MNTNISLEQKQLSELIKVYINMDNTMMISLSFVIKRYSDILLDSQFYSNNPKSGILMKIKQILITQGLL